MKKSLLALLLATALTLSAGMAWGEDKLVAVRSPGMAEDPIGLQPGTHITVGTQTQMTGYFATDLWSSNTVDVDVRSLLHAYSTVTWVGNDGLLFDGMVVAGTQMMTGDTGNRIYIISLMTDLVYNDGTPITARDYVFSLLLSSSPMVRELGGSTRSLYYIEGYDAYASGQALGIKGVRLLSDDTFSVEISAEYLPYFYGLAMLEATPLPMHVIAPDCCITDAGGGAYITGDFTADMLRETLLDPEDGYIFYPRVTSGPYQLEEHDRENHTATFVVNPNYLGNYEGIKPHIERVTVRQAYPETQMSELLSGELDIINKATTGSVISHGLSLVADSNADIEMASYMRSGYAYMGFACELGPTDRAAVRRAIAHCVDKETFVASVSPYAETVHGYYGMGQWMTSYEDVADSERGIDEGVNVAEFLPTLAVPYDLEAAKAILIEDGWTLGEDGQPYVEGDGAIRYREEDGELIPLLIKCVKTAGNTVNNSLEALLAEPFRTVGIGFEVEIIAFNAMLKEYYRITERTHNLFFLGSNFMHTFDPYFDFNTGDEYQGLANPSGLRDEILMELGLAMRQTEASNLHEYILEWMAFQERFVEMMPMIPLYSNEYFDFYSGKIANYNIPESKSWAYEVPLAWIEE